MSRAAFNERLLPSTLSLASRDLHTLIRLVWESAEQAEYFHGFVSGYAKAVFALNTAERVTLASQELMENALRYSLMAKGISYELAVSSSEVRVSVGNATIGSRVAMLQGHLQRIQQDREGTYVAELERSVSGQGRRSMLGLVRICHEANMVLNVAVENNHVTVVASCRR